MHILCTYKTNELDADEETTTAINNNNNKNSKAN